MSKDLVLVDRQDGGIVTVTLNLPKARNAMTRPVKTAFTKAMVGMCEDDTVRAIVVTGVASTFSAGGDVTVFNELTPMQGAELVHGQREFLRLMLGGSKPIIAAVEGFAFGAGFGLALACDHVVTDANASFCAAFNRIGLMPDGGLLWTLPQRVGTAKARELFQLASVVKGEEAARLGIADTLAEPGRVQEVALEKARQFAAAAPLTVAMTKAAFAAYPQKLDRLLTMEAEGQAILFNTNDTKEAVRAFMEKRPVTFTGA